MPEIFGKEEISVYRNRIGSNYLSRTMVREINKLADNVDEMKDYKYPDYVPVLHVLASDTVKEYEKVKKDGEASVDLYELADSMITNPLIQRIEIIEGNHMLQFTNPTALVSSIKSFLSTF